MRIGWRRPSQLLKSPTTATFRAFGAHGELHAFESLVFDGVAPSLR